MQQAPPPRSGRTAAGPTCPARRRSPLHDTYGFPIDLTLEMAAEPGGDVDVDVEGFTALLNAAPGGEAAPRAAAGGGSAQVADP
ncbi:hypothetical protein [Streptomyces sp. NPDC057287]|uniref:hypothetical protein n=1 Tax=Streptomyces sp. NPDC057287 TaxID=3346086 RepID=UPI00362B0E77